MRSLGTVRHGSTITWRRVAAVAATLAVAASCLLGVGQAGGDVAVAAPTGSASASATVSAGSPSTPAQLAALVDRSTASPMADVGAQWQSATTNTWVQLNWASPESVTSVQVYGAPTSPASIRTGTVSFSDGTSLALGGVLRDGIRPTTVAFPAKSVTWARFTINSTSGAGPVGIGEFGVFRTGTTPPKSVLTPSMSMTGSAGTGSGVGVAVSTEASCHDRRSPSAMVVLCPTANSVIHGKTDVRVSAPGATTVEARIWQSGTSASTDPTPISARVDESTSIAGFSFDSSQLAHGVLTVEIRSRNSAGIRDTAYLQLFNGSGRQLTVLLPTSTPPSPASGMSLAYSEEFTDPVSFSRTGVDADYSSSKPEWKGAQEFGEAIFADPSAGLDNLTAVDDDYLRIGLSPKPASFPDTMGWGRDHVGGMISSARVGGSGFSAQYGYFEARMLAPGGKGLWPAFWMLPSDNLPQPTPVVAEIDAVEIYGHNAPGNCQATHEYIDGRDNGKVQCGHNRFDSVRTGLDWHTYGVRIGRDTNTFYIDGKIVATAPQVRGGDAPMFFMANLALSGDWPIDLAGTGDSAALYVDYIRVYT